MPDLALTANYAGLRPRRDPAGLKGDPPTSTGSHDHDLLRINAHPDHRGRRRTCERCNQQRHHSLAGRPLRAIWSSAEQSVRRKLFLCGIVVRIADLLGFSMLLGASTCAPGLPRIAAGPEQRALTGSRRETCPARRRRQPLAEIQILAQRPFDGVLHRVPRAVITMASRTRGRHQPRQHRHGSACGRPQPCGRLRECRSPKSERTALDRPGVRRDAPSKKERL